MDTNKNIPRKLSWDFGGATADDDFIEFLKLPAQTRFWKLTKQARKERGFPLSIRASIIKYEHPLIYTISYTTLADGVEIIPPQKIKLKDK